MNLVPAKKYLSLACVVAAFAAVGASPALSQTVHQKTKQSSRQLYLSAPEEGSMTREQALHDCSVKASKFSNMSAESDQMANYRTCMFQHGHRGLLVAQRELAHYGPITSTKVRKNVVARS